MITRTNTAFLAESGCLRSGRGESGKRGERISSRDGIGLVLLTALFFLVMTALLPQAIARQAEFDAWRDCREGIWAQYAVEVESCR